MDFRYLSDETEFQYMDDWQRKRPCEFPNSHGLPM